MRNHIFHYSLLTPLMTQLWVFPWLLPCTWCNKENIQLNEEAIYSKADSSLLFQNFLQYLSLSTKRKYTISLNKNSCLKEKHKGLGLYCKGLIIFLYWVYFLSYHSLNYQNECLPIKDTIHAVCFKGANSQALGQN